MNRKNRPIYVLGALILLSLLTGSKAIAQLIDLRNDRQFFEQQKTVYQNWLEETGLDRALQAQEIWVDSHKVILTLQLIYSDQDTAVSAWNQLRQDFQKNSGLALEERLFFKFTTVMEIPFEQAELHIINFPKYGDIPVVDGSIYFDSAVGKVRRKGVFRTEIKGEVFIPAYDLDTSFTQKLLLTNSAQVSEQLRSKLNRQLAARIRNYFEKKTAEKYVFVVNQNPVMIEVMNIKSEVIPGGWFDFNNPNEYLMITIDHKPVVNGLQLFCTIDGKFGNGLFQPRSVRGFRDMSPDYKAELIRYTQVFVNTKLDKWVKDIINK